MRIDHVRESAKQAAPIGRRNLAPRVESLMSTRYRCIGSREISLLNRSNDLFGSWVDDIVNGSHVDS
jgi:hypothetical protein